MPPKKSEVVADALTASEFHGLVPTAVDFVGSTNIFELGSLQKVTDAMVGIEICDRGVMLISKNHLTDGCQLITWAGIKSLRLNTEKWAKAKAALPQ